MKRECLCPDPYCPTHARCIVGHELIIEPDDPAFCPDCGHDVMPVGACGVPNLCAAQFAGGKCVMRAGHAGPHGQVGLR